MVRRLTSKCSAKEQALRHWGGRCPQLLDQRIQPIGPIHPTTLTNPAREDNSVSSGSECS